MASGAKKFKFVSPGVFVAEIDNSFIPKQGRDIGPVIIGRTEKGPAMRPIRIESFSEFIQTFGNPIPGGRGGDVWRNGNYAGPTYAAYAAQAYLRANVGPITMVRLLGHDHDDETTSTGDGTAGWKTGDGPAIARSSNNGAYGLFVFNSGSFQSVMEESGSGEGRAPVSGALAAVWYLTEGSIELSGTVLGLAETGSSVTNALTGTAFLTPSIGATHEFRAIIKDSDGTQKNLTTFNFDDTSDKYIRNVFNTNPMLTNSQFTQTAQLKTAWLGQTYDRFLRTQVTGTTSGASHGVILAIESGTAGPHLMKGSKQDAQTGWFISQDLSSDYGSYEAAQMQKLFKFVGLDHGSWAHRHLKISIVDIKKSSRPETDPYGTFTVELRKITDVDNAPVTLERWSQLTLDPNSPDYIAKRVGDQYMTWSDTERRLRQYGAYPNQSVYIRVVMNEDVDAGNTDTKYLPFGAHGPVRYAGWVAISGSTSVYKQKPILEGDDGQSAFPDSEDSRFIKGSTEICGAAPSEDETAESWFMHVGKANEWTGSLTYPAVPLRLSASDGDLSDPTNAYWGFQTQREANSVRYDLSIPDHLEPLALDVSSFTPTSNGSTEHAWVFSLDDVVTDGDLTQTAYYLSGSRAAGNSATTGGYGQILDAGYDRFTAPFFGGFDGIDITEMEPFRNTRLDDGNGELDNYAFNTVKRAIDTIADPEFAEYNLMCAPGITNETITQHMVNVCQNRGDALAIIDLKGGFVPTTENTDSETSRRGSISTTITNLKNRGINSSYGCAYYPWVRALDTISNQTLWMPPSVVALGTFASSERKTELWFAPAGFNRGGLTLGSAGIPVVGVRERLTSSDRDDLYLHNINPIASFPSEGIVIFGQKTLQMERSALDRINVRRLMIFLKKQVSRLATGILFDQNVSATWNRFTSRVDPFLASVKSRFGISEYRLILDESTTTPDLIDQNVLYAKILLKPARAIEFIAIDFVVANTGASFDD